MWTSLTTFLALLSAVSLPLSAARSAGCGKNAPAGGVKTVTVNGKSRQYTLTLPSGYNSNNEYKLIFGYHWLNGNMGSVVSGGYYGLQSLSAGSAIFVAPNGLNAGWANSGGEDITFTDTILTTLKNDLCVDEKNIFATGWSYGGAMSFSAACSRPDVFKAIAVIAGAQLSGCAGGTTKVPYLGIHGAADDVLPIDAGRQLRDKFVGLNGCQSRSVTDPGRGAGNHVKTEFSCPAAYPVVWIGHGGGHVPDPKDSGQGQSWAPAEVWSFFTRPGLKGDNGGTNPPPTTTATTTSSPPSQPTGGTCAKRYEQCGGSGWAGAKCCESGTTCKFSNDWYSQCL